MVAAGRSPAKLRLPAAAPGDLRSFAFQLTFTRDTGTDQIVEVRKVKSAKQAEPARAVSTIETLAAVATQPRDRSSKRAKVKRRRAPAERSEEFVFRIRRPSLSYFFSLQHNRRSDDPYDEMLSVNPK